MLENMKNIVKVKYAFHPKYQSNIYFHNSTEKVQKAVIFMSICYLCRSCCL